MFRRLRGFSALCISGAFAAHLCAAAGSAQAEPLSQYLVSAPGGVSDLHLRAAAGAVLRVDARYPNIGSRLVSTTAAGAAALAADPQVSAVAPNRTVALQQVKVRALKLKRQEVPTGVARVGGPLSSAASGDGVGAVDVDVAVLDSGIDPQHPDLHVVGGVDCTGSGSWADAFGHGTHVAGIVGALDNRQGVVGVAPGARLWSVRVLDSAGTGSVASIMCGLDWVVGASNILEVANLSLQGPGSSSCADGLLGAAVCRAVDAGVVVVAAAGNGATDVAGVSPASVPIAITVSALADTDGRAGGLGPLSCTGAVDDRLMPISNVGTGVDLVAPGDCITSTWPGGYEVASGTSMAAPHVAGAAALMRSRQPWLTPPEVERQLLLTGSADWDSVGDPDGEHEPLVQVAGL